MQRKTGGAQEQVRLVKRANMRTNDREEEQQEATTPVLRILLRGAQKQRHPSHCGSPTAKHRKGLWGSHSVRTVVGTVGFTLWDFGSQTLSIVPIGAATIERFW